MKSLLFIVAFAWPWLNPCRASDLDKIVVTVNGQAIAEGEVLKMTDSRINAEAARDAAKGLLYDESSRDATRAYMRDDVLHMMIERMLIATQLKADGLEITATTLDARLFQEASQRGQTLEQAAAEMKKEGQTVESVKGGLWQTMGVERLFAAHAKDTNEMTDADALQFYDANYHYFERPEERRVSRILIRVSPDASQEARDAARAKADGILKRIKGGDDFASLAKECSEDNTTKLLGGDRGWSARGLLFTANADPFGDVAFAMKSVGGLSGVVETQDGYDLIKLTGLKPASEPAFMEVEPQIKTQFRFRQIGEFWNQYGEALWAKADLQWSPEEKMRQAKKEEAEREYAQKMEREAARENAESNSASLSPGRSVANK